jgi:hypothetical protein
VIVPVYVGLAVAHRTHFVANTRWWPPFCLVIDWVVAAIIAVEILAGVDF